MIICYIILTFLIAGCEIDSDFATVKESHWLDLSKEKQHQVASGETLFSIAFKYEKDYEQLAKINNLRAPYDLSVGQILILDKQSKEVVPVNNITHIYEKFVNKWQWPLKGKIIKYFNPNLGNKGIDIATRYAQNVRSSAPGKVVYAGDGLIGYGKLIIIKHDNNYLSAYANNSRILIREGDFVNNNKIIAKSGKLVSSHNGIHFEIRKNGIPVNPLKFIKSPGCVYK